MEQKLIELLTKLEEGVVKLTPEAWELALQAARIEALQVLIVGFIALFVFLVSLLVSYLGYKGYGKEGLSHDEKEPYAVLCVGSAVFSVIPFCVAMGHLTQAIAWVGVSHPEVWIAYKLLN